MVPSWKLWVGYMPRTFVNSLWRVPHCPAASKSRIVAEEVDLFFYGLLETVRVGDLDSPRRAPHDDGLEVLHAHNRAAAALAVRPAVRENARHFDAALPGRSDAGHAHAGVVEFFADKQVRVIAVKSPDFGASLSSYSPSWIQR